MANIRDISNSKHVNGTMIGKRSEIGAAAGDKLATMLAEEKAKPATTPEERAWRRYNSPERRNRVAEGALKAAQAASQRCEP
jgi:hypothetical protein